MATPGGGATEEPMVYLGDKFDNFTRTTIDKVGPVGGRGRRREAG